MIVYSDMISFDKKSYKGQLISKCPFGFIVWTNFLEAFWGFLQASLFMILHTKSPGSPQEGKKNSGQKFRNNFVGNFVQTMKPKGHFEIN